MKKEKEKIWKDHRSSGRGDKAIDKKEEEENKWIITIYNNEAIEEITLIMAIIVRIMTLTMSPFQVCILLWIVKV